MPVTGTVVIATDGNIYVPTSTYLYVFDSEGQNLAEISVSYGISTSPAIASNGNLYIGDSGGSLSSISPLGTRQWWLSVSSGYPILSSPAIAADGSIYFGAYNNRVYAVSKTGVVLWTYTGPPHSSPIVYSSPAIASNGYIYIGLKAGYLCILSPTGSLMGSFITYLSAEFGYNSPSIGPDGTVYIGDASGYVYALNPSTGGNPTLKWTYKTGYGVTSVAIASDGTLWFGSSNGYLYNLYPSGSLLFQYSLAGAATGPPSITADGTVYIASGYYINAIYRSSTSLKEASSSIQSSGDDSKVYIESFFQMKLQDWSFKMHGEKWTSAGTAFTMVGAVASFLFVGVFLVKYHAKSKNQDTNEVVSSI